MGTDKGLLLVLVLSTFLCGWFVGTVNERTDAAKLCRHTIQRNFGTSSDEAQSLIDETREWESK